MILYLLLENAGTIGLLEPALDVRLRQRFFPALLAVPLVYLLNTLNVFTLQMGI